MDHLSAQFFVIGLTALCKSKRITGFIPVVYSL